MKKYNTKIWLAPKHNPSTASIVCFAGVTKWRSDLPEFDNYFIEISDCSSKIRLHKTDEESVADFINKLKKLNNSLEKYIKHLEGLDTNE